MQRRAHRHVSEPVHMHANRRVHRRERSLSRGTKSYRYPYRPIPPAIHMLKPVRDAPEQPCERARGFEFRALGDWAPGHLAEERPNVSSRSSDSHQERRSLSAKPVVIGQATMLHKRDTCARQATNIRGGQDELGRAHDLVCDTGPSMAHGPVDRAPPILGRSPRPISL